MTFSKVTKVGSLMIGTAAVSLLLALTAMPAVRAAGPCLSDENKAQKVSGILTIESKGNAKGSYILKLAAPACLSTEDPDEKVAATRTIHVFSTDDAVLKRIASTTGKRIVVHGRPFAAHTRYHHAPIVMNVSAFEPG